MNAFGNVYEIEEKDSLYIRLKKINSMVVIRTHNIIANDLPLAPRYLATQEQEVTHFEDTLRLIGGESQQACQRR